MRIKYKGKYVDLASGKCKTCGGLMESLFEGHWVECDCGSSFVDTCRGMPYVHRYGGNVKYLSHKELIKLKKGDSMPAKKTSAKKKPATKKKTVKSKLPW